MRIEIEVSDASVIACMLGADARYWARDLVWESWTYSQATAAEPGQGPGSFALGTGHVTEHFDKERRPIRHSLNTRKIRIGVTLLATRHPRHFAKLMSGQWDANTGEVLLQLIVLGEVKYV